jgi:RNA polymerase sigma-70 factor (ECF subfamily)
MMVGELSLGWQSTEAASEASHVAALDVAALVAAFSPLLYRIAFSIVRSRADAEDVVQETFVRVIEDPARFARVREPRPWLVRIAWNLALDRVRRITPVSLDEELTRALASPERPADAVLAEARRFAQVLAAVDRLPARERKVLLLAAIEELTTAEIAAVLKKSESSVRSLLFRARAHLKERLERTSHAQQKGGPE